MQRLLFLSMIIKINVSNKINVESAVIPIFIIYLLFSNHYYINKHAGMNVLECNQFKPYLYRCLYYNYLTRICSYYNL